MPDEKGKLTADETKKAFSWLKLKLRVRTCPMCGEEDFGLSESIYAMPLSGSGAINLSECAPAIAMLCSNCGYMRFFNALMAGVVKQQPPPEGEKDAGARITS